MDGLRPVMPPNMQGQFCPVCRLLHFPFCHPAAMSYPQYAPPYGLPPPRFDSPARSNYALPQEHPSNSMFAARYPSGELVPLTSSHYHNLPVMHPHMPPESGLGSVARIDRPGFPPGGRLEMGREREQQFYKQQNQAAGMADRFHQPSFEEHAAGKVSRVNNAADSAFARKQHLERSLQDSHQQPHGSNLRADQFMPSWRGPENGLGHGFPKDHFGQDGSWGPTQGFSKSSFEVSETVNHSSRGDMPWDHQRQAEQSQESRHGIAGRPYSLADRHYPYANLDVSSVIDSQPYLPTVAKSIREQNWNGPRDEKLMAEHDLEASKVKEGVLRQQEMFMQQGLQLKGSERVGAMRMQEESVTRPAAVRKSSKRKRTITDISSMQPMSREEELLIEQGLLDDDSTSSESDSGSEHTKQKQGVTSVGSKQVAPQEESALPLKSILTAKEQASEFGLQKKQGITGDIKQGAADIYSMRRFSRNSDGWTSSWSLETHSITKDHSGQSPFDGLSRNGTEKGPTGEALYSRSWHPTHSVRVAEMQPPLNGGKMDIAEGTTQRKDEVLQQYQEWEAEQCHMEAVKKAEEMAREIRQRDEHVLKTGSSHPAPLQDVPLQQHFSQEHQNVNQSHLEPAPRYQSSQSKKEQQELGLDHLKAKIWHPSHAVQHLNASSHHHSFVHESHMYEQQDTRRQDKSLQHDSQPSSVMHKASHLSQHSMYSSESSLQQHAKSSADELHEWSRQLGIHDVHLHQAALGQRLSLPNAQPQKTQVAAEKLQARLLEQQKWQQEHLVHLQDQTKWNAPEQQSSHYPNSGEHQLHIPNQNWQSTAGSFGQCYGSGVGIEGTQYILGRPKEPYRNFPPLPDTDPLMPNSPPPPPPTGPPPPLEMPTPAPPALSSIVSAGVVAGHQCTFYTEGLKSQNVHNQNSESLDNRQQEQQSLHGVPVISQSSVGLAGNQQSQISSAPSKQSEKSKVDAVNIFRNPGRLTRPDQFVVILRGLPGSGKSYLAKALRDVEVMNGGNAPRIHSMDDYFMTEVEKTEDDETGASSLRGRKKIVKRVMEYCFEAEMEEVYRASMLKAFRKTLEEGMFNFVIVDDRNVLVADFAQFWATAKRSGYEVYILEAGYNDVAGCGARNVHSFTVEQIQSMADRWEPTPPLYLQLDVSSLFRGDDLNSQDIIEVEMDADDMERDLEEEEEKSQSSQEQIFRKDYHTEKGKPVLGEKWGDKTEPSGDRAVPKSKRRAEDNRIERTKESRDTSNALSGLMSTYGKKDKFVHWADNQGVKGGYSIGHKNAPLVIGPGPGYNVMSNPTLEEMDKNQLGADSRRKTRFIEQLRAEQETFKAAFARRRQRIGGMEDEEDD